MAQIGLGGLSIEPDSRIHRTRPLRLDFSGVAKGFAVDQVAESLEALGISQYMVDIGGEVRVGTAKWGGEPWVIGIEKPLDGVMGQAQLAVKLEEMSIATSGDYRNYFEEQGRRYGHTIDPANGYPIRHKLASASVLHVSNAYADAFATALMVLGEDKALELANRLALPVYLLVREGDGFVSRHSDAFAGYLASD
jgi:thiamine biosynthesis lipoprotein